MPTPTYTPPPTPPTRGDATTFSARVAAFLAWIVTFVAELITATSWFAARSEEVAEASSDIAAAALVAADAAGLVGKMTGSLAHGAGTKAVLLASARPDLAVPNKQVVILLDSDAAIRMFGVIASSPTPTPTAFSVTVTSGGVFPTGGAGTLSGWKIIDAAFFGAAATAADILAASSDAASVTPKGLKDALARFVLTDGSPVTGLSGLNGLDFFWTLTANRTMPQLTNTYPGARGTITAKQDGVGGRILAVHSSFKRRGGLGVLSTAAGAEDEIPYEVKTVDGSGNATRVIYDVIKAPS